MGKRKKIKKIPVPEVGPRLPKHIEEKLRYGKTVKARCLILWAEAVKARAGGRSELSGSEGRLHAHHIVGRKGAAGLMLSNGICLTAGEHFVYHHGRAEDAARIDIGIVDFIGGYEQKKLLYECTKALVEDWVKVETDLRQAILMYLAGPNG